MGSKDGNHFTLFVDESGDFTSRKGEWVLAGLLCPGSLQETEASLCGAATTVLGSFGIASLADCHLTELRKQYGHREATRFAGAMLEALLDAHPGATLLSALNRLKKRVATAERTYRLMLLDLLSLADAALGGNTRLDGLDVVVATRTADGNPMSTASDIREDVLRALPEVMEVGLASRGLVEIAADDTLRLHLEPASSVWGLMAADLLANLTYNRRHADSGQQLAAIEEQDRLRSFASLGGHEARRARVAERDGDHIGALHLWASLETKQCAEERTEALQRLWSHVLRHEGARGPRATLEAVIERCHEACRDHPEARTVAMVTAERLEEGLGGAAGAQHSTAASELLVRLRNYLLVLTTQVGDSQRAARLIENQGQAMPDLVQLPEGFRLMLDFRPLEIEALLNDLQVERARDLAVQYDDLMAHYAECWELVRPGMEFEDLWATYDFVRARGTRWRMETFCRSAMGGELSEAVEGLTGLHGGLPPGSLKSRARNYLTVALVKSGALVQALQWSTEPLQQSERVSVWDRSAALMAGSTASLAGISECSTLAGWLLDRCATEAPPRQDAEGHPVDLIWRDLALLKYELDDDPQGALEYLAHADRCLEAGRRPSPITVWLAALLSAHRDYVKGRLRPVRAYTEDLPSADLHVATAERLADEMGPLVAMRHVSPY